VKVQENAVKTKYVVMPLEQKAGRSHNVETANNSFERVEVLKYLGTNLTDQNSIQEEIRSILKPENASYHSV
jgi:hypothetical protein